MMNIVHRPMFDTTQVEKHYSEKDGVVVNYICTSALDSGNSAVDVFFRHTPHPEFGNRYFGLYDIFDVNKHTYTTMITNADAIEDVEFNMVKVNGEWHYSRHRHDFHCIGDVCIDGGRAYFRLLGNVHSYVKTFVVKNGEFVET